MKIEIKSINNDIRAGFYILEDKRGLLCYISYDNANYEVGQLLFGNGQLFARIYWDVKEIGSITFIGENDEEKKFFDPPYKPWWNYEDDTEYFLLIPFDFHRKAIV